jgi:hypothetical protein
MLIINSIGSVMVSMVASSLVDCGFEPRSGQIKDYKMCICYFSAKYAALRRKSKDWVAHNQDNVSEWDDMSICGLLLKHVGLVQSGPYHHLIENNLFSP